MTAATISAELSAHLTKSALELEQLADSIESGVIDPKMLAPALQLVTIAARRLLESCAEPPLRAMASAQRDQAAIDDERVTGDVAGLVGKQERSGVGDLPRGALASERDRAVFATWVGFAGSPVELGVTYRWGRSIWMPAQQR